MRFPFLRCSRCDRKFDFRRGVLVVEEGPGKGTYCGQCILAGATP
jgi:hypothetical protein